MLIKLTIMIEKVRVIFNTFREHIVELSNSRALRDRYVVCPDPKKRGGLFSRMRVWTFRVLTVAIMSCFRKSLSVEVMEFLRREKLPQTTPEAYIIRRGLISDELFRDLNTFLLKEADAKGLIPRWHGGRYLCGIDGTRLSLPYTPDLYKKYRQRSDRGHNLARGVFVTDLLGRTIVAADIVPNNTEERKAALALLCSHEFPMDLQSTVFVMDRGYPSLFLMNWFHKNTGGFVIRACRHTAPAVARFMDSDSTEATVELELSSNRHDIAYPKPEPLTVRLVKRPMGKGEPVVLVTDLDPLLFPAAMILEAYRMRWNVETEIGTAKNQLQIEIVSGNREICVRQDFFAAVLIYNMETLIRIPLDSALAARAARLTYRVDMNCTWLLMVALVAELLRPPDRFDCVLTFCVKFFLRTVSAERPNRSFPRIKRSIKVNGKYMPFTNYKRGL